MNIEDITVGSDILVEIQYMVKQGHLSTQQAWQMVSLFIDTIIYSVNKLVIHI